MDKQIIKQSIATLDGLICSQYLPKKKDKHPTLSIEVSAIAFFIIYSVALR